MCCAFPPRSRTGPIDTAKGTPALLESITTPLARRLRRGTTAALDRVPAGARTRPLALRWRSLPESDARRALEHCADALESAGVDYFLVNGRNPHEYTIGVRESDRGRALQGAPGQHPRLGALQRREHEVSCLTDAPPDPVPRDEQLRLMGAFLGNYFPLRAPWEGYTA